MRSYGVDVFRKDIFMAREEDLPAWRFCHGCRLHSEITPDLAI
jgi:hypothetical protein